LAEHPNRAILARVADPPQIELLPFEEKVEITINGIKYNTSTTLYKGDINISFVMDEPHWYAIVNILGIKNGDFYEDKWKVDPQGPDSEENYISIFASKDALKIMYEDGIPLGSMIEDSMLLGNGAYANVNNDRRSCVWDENVETEDPVPNRDGLSGAGACIDGSVGGVTYRGFIAGPIIRANGEGIDALTRNEAGYFFYAGTAPAPTIISFDLTPVMSSG